MSSEFGLPKKRRPCPDPYRKAGTRSPGQAVSKTLHHQADVSFPEKRAKPYEGLLIYTQTGFRIPVYRHLNTTIQFDYDYDKAPAPGSVNEDSAIIFTLGYQWEG